jgi:hypothetical protein
VRSTATEVRVVADGVVIAEHARRFGRDQLICDPWHYLPILERKPGALRNGVPFLDWDLKLKLKLPRFRGVATGLGNYGSAVTFSMTAS